MANNRPQSLTAKEWREIRALPAVREAWGLDEDTTPEQFAESVYAAKFDFVSGSPGYVGELYILQGDAMTDRGPVVLGRDDSGALTVFS